ncbi:hypothetical protein QR680_013165 [Steinernema hermaphroditum]|uniref:Uncharacterized protein n=1 Tax=Steinernema hermaphroditum TaxID=289476 RepID=A0AA39M231_9BILA|nr:hypothetical protein QR680_013165 [Steinernema hermaphroditum]
MHSQHEQSLVAHGIEGGIETGEEHDEGFESDQENEEHIPDRHAHSFPSAGKRVLKNRRRPDFEKEDVTILRIQLLQQEIQRSELQCQLLREKLLIVQEKRQLLRHTTIILEDFFGE